MPMESPPPNRPQVGLATAIKALLFNQLLLLLGGLVGGMSVGFWIALTHAGLSQPQFQKIIPEYYPTLVGVGGLVGMLLNLFYLHWLRQANRAYGLSAQLGLERPPGFRPWKHLGQGSALALCFLALTIVLAMAGHRPHGKGPLAQLASESLLTWTVLAVGFAPWVEEHIFRGLVFSGLHARWGTKIAGFLATTIFVFLHWGEVSHFWVAGLFITAVALLCLRLRLRTGSIYPGIWLHLGYNATLASFLWLARSLK